MDRENCSSLGSSPEKKLRCVGKKYFASRVGLVKTCVLSSNCWGFPGKTGHFRDVFRLEIVIFWKGIERATGLLTRPHTRRCGIMIRKLFVGASLAGFLTLGA